FFEPFAVAPFENTNTSSCADIGLFLAFKKFDAVFLTQIHLYLNNFSFELINLYENEPLAVNTIAPLSFIILSYCSHNSSNGIIRSQSALTISYGKSVNIISILLSGISFIPSIQSSLNTLFNS